MSRVLGDGLDDELAVGQVAEVVGEGQAGEGPVPLLLAELAAPYAPVEGGGDTAAAGFDGVVGGFGDTDVEAAAGGDFGDAGAHEAAADDAETSDGIHLRSNLMSGRAAGAGARFRRCGGTGRRLRRRPR